METNVLYNQDCLKGMQEIPDESIDLVVTDCPYHISHHGTSCGGGIFSDLQNKHANSGKLFAHNDISYNPTKTLSVSTNNHTKNSIITNKNSIKTKYNYQ